MQLTIKNLSLFLLLAFFTLNTTANENFGQSSEKAQIAADSERVNSLVANSSEYRRSIKVGRSVAGQSAKDLQWAQEFESLMKSTEDVDYLEEALKL